MSLKRCEWVGINKPFYEKYHDEEWGVPVYDDNKHFEMLILEGAQAGLSWETILKKREYYRAAFKNFAPEKVALMRDEELEDLITNSNIVKNRAKIYSARNNAKAFLNIKNEFQTFNSYVWRFVNEKQIINHWQSINEIPTSSIESNALSHDLKRRGMKFVGSTIIYSYMQAIGMVNDHITSCWRYKPV